MSREPRPGDCVSDAKIDAGNLQAYDCTELYNLVYPDIGNDGLYILDNTGRDDAVSYSFPAGTI